MIYNQQKAFPVFFIQIWRSLGVCGGNDWMFEEDGQLIGGHNDMDHVETSELPIGMTREEDVLEHAWVLSTEELAALPRLGGSVECGFRWEPAGCSPRCIERKRSLSFWCWKTRSCKVCLSVFLDFRSLWSWAIVSLQREDTAIALG